MEHIRSALIHLENARRLTVAGDEEGALEALETAITSLAKARQAGLAPALAANPETARLVEEIRKLGRQMGRLASSGLDFVRGWIKVVAPPGDGYKADRRPAAEPVLRAVSVEG